jgi:hypothetical protein
MEKTIVGGVSYYLVIPKYYYNEQTNKVMGYENPAWKK